MSSALMKRIKIAAAENDRSINAEILARLEGSFNLASTDRQELRTLLAEAMAIVEHTRKK
jgi:hypothetical protein